MGLRSSIPPIHNPYQPFPDAYMNDIYAGSPDNSSVHLVGSADASCSSCHISFTDCLTAVKFSRFTHAGSLPSIVFTDINTPFYTGMPIFVWPIFPMAEQNILKITCPLRLIDFRALNFYIFLVLVLCTFMICQNYTLALTFFFFHKHLYFYNLSSDIGCGFPYLVTGGGGKTVCIPWISELDISNRCSSNFGCHMLMK